MGLLNLLILTIEKEIVSYPKDDLLAVHWDFTEDEPTCWVGNCPIGYLTPDEVLSAVGGCEPNLFALGSNDQRRGRGQIEGVYYVHAVIAQRPEQGGGIDPGDGDLQNIDIATGPG